MEEKLASDIGPLKKRRLVLISRKNYNDSGRSDCEERSHNEEAKGQPPILRTVVKQEVSEDLVPFLPRPPRPPQHVTECITLSSDEMEEDEEYEDVADRFEGRPQQRKILRKFSQESITSTTGVPIIVSEYSLQDITAGSSGSSSSPSPPALPTGAACTSGSVSGGGASSFLRSPDIPVIPASTSSSSQQAQSSLQAPLNPSVSMPPFNFFNGVAHPSMFPPINPVMFYGYMIQLNGGPVSCKNEFTPGGFQNAVQSFSFQSAPQGYPQQFSVPSYLICFQCQAKFSVEAHLRSHVKQDHSDTCWKCPKCQEVMLSPTELEQHYNQCFKCVA